MKSEEFPAPPAGEIVHSQTSSRGTAGFMAGVLFGAFLGAGFALLFAPERGEKTRGKLGRRMRSLRDDAREGIDRVGGRTVKELKRRERRVRAELARARERAERALE